MMKNRIVFLQVPESLREQLERGARFDFPIDPDIPIPVEVTEENEQYFLENLSMDMILSGMLRVLETGDAQQEWLDYFSSFILFIRPDILTKLRELKDSGLDDENFIKAHEFIKQGKTEEGLNCIRDFLERFPLVWNGWFMLGWALRLLARYKDGEAAFRKAIELGGDNSDTRNELAICLMEMGDMAAAKRELETALKADSENVKIISNLGMLAAKNGESELAAAFFRTVLEIDSKDPVAKKYLFGQS